MAGPYQFTRNYGGIAFPVLPSTQMPASTVDMGILKAPPPMTTKGPPKPRMFDRDMIGQFGQALLANAGNGGDWAGAIGMAGQAFNARKEQMRQQEEAENRRKEMAGVLGELDPIEQLAMQFDPQSVIKARMESKSAREKPQVSTFWDPVSKSWNVRPELVYDEGFGGVNTADGVQFTGQRPMSYQEHIDLRANQEKARAAKANEAAQARNSDIARMNADTARMNATGGAPPPPPGAGQGPPTSRGAGYIPTNSDPYGGDFVQIGIGPNGEYVQDASDGEMVDGMPRPPYNELDLVGKGSKGPIIRKENEEIAKLGAAAENALHMKALGDEFMSAVNDGVPLGTVWNNPAGAAGRFFDPRSDRLGQINSEMALQVGEQAKGAMSEKDREWLRKGVLSVENRLPANQAYALRLNAASNRMTQRHAFLQLYQSRFGPGHLQYAQKLWNDYTLAVPLFDDAGNPISDQPNIDEWFAGKPSRGGGPFRRKTPATGGKAKGVEAATDDELLSALGLK